MYGVVLYEIMEDGAIPFPDLDLMGVHERVVTKVRLRLGMGLG